MDLTFLDAVWNQAPFRSHDEFVSTVEATTAEWEGRGLLAEHESIAIIHAARRAEADLGV